MSRLTTMSPEALRAVFSPDADSDLFVLLTIVDQDNPTNPIYLCDGYTIRLSETDQEVVYGVRRRKNGVNYDHIFLPMSITLPSEEEAQAPRCTITINDVTRYLTPVIRELSNPPKVTMELVLSKNLESSAPTVDTFVEASFSGFYITGFNYNRDSVSMTMTMVDYDREPFPSHTFSPKYFPGLF